MFDFASLQRPRTPNTALYADPGDTPGAADRGALRFVRPPGEVIAAWDAAARAEPRVTVADFDPEAGTHACVQRSRLFRFPDDVHAKAVAEGEGTRLLLYSASRIGKGDFGVNAKRLARWSDALRERLEGAGS
ncbi:DUF1499 domain-containing protein [Parvularcula dongshanensis]|uniref:Uncharacterized protein (DUF1499 family) n=1 Tax=Parvularcula dongshanensis TaxID=1173995 RepID=A0A840I506_9PROT|nr:DUF1499 domain-containing protein [Parvularcula dongshanensis]MBB4659919.1 uncharacterized protein (DUF1499 family) [Parvularcula dongshanensis]